MSKEAEHLLVEIIEDLAISVERITEFLSDPVAAKLSREQISTIEVARYALDRTRGHIVYALEQVCTTML